MNESDATAQGLSVEAVFAADDYSDEARLAVVALANRIVNIFEYKSEYPPHGIKPDIDATINEISDEIHGMNVIMGIFMPRDDDKSWSEVVEDRLKEAGVVQPRSYLNLR